MSCYEAGIVRPRNTTYYTTGNHLKVVISERRGESEHKTLEDRLIIATRSIPFISCYFLAALFCVHVRFYARKQLFMLLGYPGSRVLSGYPGTRVPALPGYVCLKKWVPGHGC